MKELSGFSNEELQAELLRRREQVQSLYTVPVVETTFGYQLDMDDWLSELQDQVCPINWKEEEDGYVSPDCVILMLNGGRLRQLTPVHLCLPHQLYHKTVIELLEEHHAEDAWVVPVWNKTLIEVTK